MESLLTKFHDQRIKIIESMGQIISAGGSRIFKITKFEVP